MQNRVSSALPRLPEAVQAQGVTVQKQSTAILMFVTLTSPDKAVRQPLPRQLRHHPAARRAVARLPGVGNVTVFGAGQYSMRVWLDPEQAQGARADAQDVVEALQQQSQQVTAGQVGMPPAPSGADFQYTVDVAGRLSESTNSKTSWSRPAVSGGDHAGQGCRPRRARRADLRPDFHAGRPAGRGARHLPDARRERARGRAGGQGAHGRTRRARFRRA